MMKIVAKSFLFALLIVLLSCEKDEKKEVIDNNKEFDTSLMVGEWYRSYGNYVEDITFTKNLRFTGVVYDDLSTTPTIADNLSGAWGLGTYGTVLFMDTYRTSTGNTVIDYYDIGVWDNYTLQLIDKEFGNQEYYHRIIESIKLQKGQNSDFDYIKDNSISVTNYSSSNTSIATVDNEGKVVANGSGIAFITITSTDGTFVMKVEVAS